MDKKPKAKEVAHSLKEHAVAEVKDKVHTAGIKSKDRVLEQVKEEVTHQAPAPNRQTESQSAESYATDRVEDSAQRIAENTVVTTERAVKYGVQRIKEQHAEKQAAEAIETQFAEEPVTPEVLEQQLLEQPVTSTPELPQTPTALPKDGPSTPDVQSPPDTPFSKPTQAREEPLLRNTFPERNAKSESPPSDRIKQKQTPTEKEKSESPAVEVKSKVNVVREKSEVRMPRSRAGVVPVSDGTASAETVKSTGRKKAPVSKVETTKTVSVEPAVSQMQHSQQTAKKRLRVQAEPPVSNAVPPRTDSIPGKEEPISLSDQSVKPTKYSMDKPAIKTHEREVRTPDTVAAKEKADVHPREIRHEVKSTARKQGTLVDAPVAKSSKSEVSAATAPKGKDAASAKPTTAKKAPSATVREKAEQNVKKRGGHKSRSLGVLQKRSAFRQERHPRL